MRVLVTGGLGFIGQAVVRRLVNGGHEVTVLTRRAGDPRARALPAGVRVLAADLADPTATAQALAGERFDGACHLAGRARLRESFSDPVGYWRANLAGTANLLAALAAASARTGQPARLVFASTGMVYAPGDGTPVSEDHPAAPASPYGASKLACEQLISQQAATGQLGAVSLRVFTAAGAVGGHTDQDRTRLIPKALAVAAGRDSHLEINGDGSAVREFTHLADVAEAYLLALKAARPGEHRVYNVGSGQGVTVREVLATVEQVTGRPLPAVHRPRQPEPPALLASTGRIRAELGWAPRHSTLRQVITDAWAAMHARAETLTGGPAHPAAGV